MVFTFSLTGWDPLGDVPQWYNLIQAREIAGVLNVKRAKEIQIAEAEAETP
jgi:hypothetical protein